MGVENYIFLVWNRIRIWRTGRQTPTKNSQEYLYYAAQHGHANIVRLLVKHGPDIGTETSLRSRCLEEMGARKNGWAYLSCLNG